MPLNLLFYNVTECFVPTVKGLIKTYETYEKPISFSQLSVNGVGLTKPLTTSLSPTSKHSSHLRKLSKGGR